MPQFSISDPRTGQKVQISAPRQPTESELRYLWQHPEHALPQTLTDPVKLNLDPLAQEAAAAPLAIPPGTLRPAAPRAPAAPPPATPLQLFSGVTSAPAAAAMGSLADDPGDALKAIHEALQTAWLAPMTPTDQQTGMGKELKKRGVPMGEGMTAAVDIFSDPTNLIGGDMIGDVAKAAVIGGPSVVKGLGRLYTRLAEEVLPRFKAKAAHPSRIMSDVKNFGSPMEAEWTGLTDWLTSKGNTPVTREEFEKHVKDNPLKITEKVYRKQPVEEGEYRFEEDYGELEQPQGTTRWGPGGQADLTLPGGKNYREIILTLPEQRAPLTQPRDLKAEGWTTRVIKDNPLTNQRDVNIIDPSGATMLYRSGTRLTPDEVLEDFALDHAEDASKASQKALTYEHKVHWPGVKNPLAHIRLNDRVTADGKKALHIEELQSDWHQKGREAGYGAEGAVDAWLQKKGGSVGRDNKDGWYFHALGRKHLAPSATTMEEAQQAQRKYAKANGATTAGVPDAPYKGTAWAELGFKRALIEAVESGADEVTWTTGRQQSERYGNQLKNVTAVRHNADGWQIKNENKWIDADDSHLAEVRRYLPKEDQPKFDTWRENQHGFEKGGDSSANRVLQHEDALEQLSVLRESQANIERNMRDALLTEFGVPATAFQTDLAVTRAAHAVETATEETPAVAAMRRRLNEHRVNAASAAMLKSNVDELAKMPAAKNATFHFSAPLEVGSSGMRQHYDEAMVNIANKLGKKYDAQVGKTLVPKYRRFQEVHSLPITEKLRQQILDKGLPLAAAAPLGMLPGQDDAPPDKPEPLVTPKLAKGRSPLLTVGGQKGRFNFDVPPEEGGTPAPRYAFDTEDGGRWFFQLEKRLQGGRWEGAHHAEADFRRYKALDPATRTATMEAMWGNSPIAAVIDKAAADKVSFGELRRRLKPHNTHRQISDGEPKPK